MLDASEATAPRAHAMKDEYDSRMTTITAAIRATATERALASAPKKRLLKRRAAPVATDCAEAPLRMDLVRWDAATRARFASMIGKARYNLNGAADNAVAEALALAHLYRHGDVVPEREMLRCAGIGEHLAGTPDGAVVLAPGRMAAAQVVRTRAPRGARGVGALLRVCLAKVHRSLRWLVASGLGDDVCAFTIAVWLPRRLSNRALAATHVRLRAVARWLDPRFDFVLLVPPPDARARIFPPNFGASRDGDAADEADDEALRELAREIRGYCEAWRKSAALCADDADPLGFLVDLLS